MLRSSELTSGRASVALLLVRLVVGAAFVCHGAAKLQHPFDWMGAHSWAPSGLQALAASIELFGGAALFIGLLTPIACLSLMVVMLTALLTVHFPHGDAFVSVSDGKASFELALVYLSVVTSFLLLGPGSISVDAFMLKPRRPARPFMNYRFNPTQYAPVEKHSTRSYSQRQPVLLRR